MAKLTDEQKTRAFCKLHYRSFDSAKQLSESAADELDLYLNDDFEVPQFIVDIALEFIPLKGE
jgi:hypothetical protein